MSDLVLHHTTVLKTGVTRLSYWVLKPRFVNHITIPPSGDSRAVCIERERQALLKFKEGLTDPSNLLSSWVGHDCSRWRGVVCNNRTGHVVKLDLGNPRPFNIDDYNRRSLGGEILPCLLELRHLNYLDLSKSNFNGIRIPDWIGSFKKLKYLNLSKSGFGGAIPHQLGNLSSLHFLDLNNDFGVSSDYFLRQKLDANNLQWLSLLSSLRFLDMGRVNLSMATDWLQVTNTLPLLEELRLAHCQLPNVPASLPHVNFTRLSVLDLSSNSIESKMPAWLFNLSSLLFLDLSNNMFNGNLPENIDDRMPELNFLSLSQNQIEGGIPLSVCKMKYLVVLDLSQNQLSSRIPGCWHDSMVIMVMDLGNNNLSGEIPDSMGSLLFLKSLHLSNNNLSGEVPSSLKNCTSLVSLDLSGNQFTGNIPVWIGESLTSLRFLMLRSNMFYGNIPPQLSLLSALQLLDLAQNNLSGTIPSSFSNLSTMAVLQREVMPVLYDLSGTIAKITKKNRTSVVVPMIYLDSYGEVISLDLSNNNLSGEIPQELTGLFGLVFLNLSGNHLTGMIPGSISRLQVLESLDLSRNQLSGVIPPSMTNLTFLIALDLSYNNLSGPIPLERQFSTFTNSSFIGNHDLCGVPLSKRCGDESPKVGSKDREEEREESADARELILLCTSIELGFVVGFWGFCGVLVFKKPCRIAYYRFMDDMKERFLSTVERKTPIYSGNNVIFIYGEDL
ncbi:receptor-like protein EIX1 [Magnolia sinica]|uniref:receptor-like protein EIX1 n=1 Tax=Magnolia sinica TaxID=86752 RepID=UPI002659DFA4|nr:receptor-like protein EIX1 [Magnolia sinica]